MVGQVREKMASGAALLPAKRGLDGTSFSTVLELTGAPRGPVYHHFPGGKDELVGAALGAANAKSMAALDSMTGAAADDAAERPEQSMEPFDLVDDSLLDEIRESLTGLNP